jgi:DNA-binding transcriptional LysR family regulator
VAITLAPPKEGKIVARKLVDYRLGLFASPSYLADAPALTEPDDLHGHAVIGYIDDLIFTPELDYLDEVSRGLRARTQSSNLNAQMAMVAAGGGVCVLPHFMAQRHAGLVQVLADKVSIQRSFWLVVHADLKDVARVRTTVDFIVRETRAARALFQGEGQPALAQAAE